MVHTLIMEVKRLLICFLDYAFWDKKNEHYIKWVIGYSPFFRSLSSLDGIAYHNPMEQHYTYCFLAVYTCFYYRIHSKLSSNVNFWDCTLLSQWVLFFLFIQLLLFTSTAKQNPSSLSMDWLTQVSSRFQISNTKVKNILLQRGIPALLCFLWCVGAYCLGCYWEFLNCCAK